MVASARDDDAPLHVTTLVVDLPIGKIDALDVIAFVADGAVQDAGTASPRVALGATSWAEVEIPRFGDPPPLAIDVFSTESAEDAERSARRLGTALEGVGWSLREPRADEV